MHLRYPNSLHPYPSAIRYLFSSRRIPAGRRRISFSALRPLAPWSLGPRPPVASAIRYPSFAIFPFQLFRPSSFGPLVPWSATSGRFRYPSFAIFPGLPSSASP